MPLLDDESLTSWALSKFDSLEENTNTRTNVLVAAGGTLATIGLWVVHWIYPYVLADLVELQNKFVTLCAFVIVLAPPFVVAFCIASIIWRRRATNPIDEESGPMSGYFYRERADSRWKIVFLSALVAATNLMLMLITSDSL